MKIKALLERVHSRWDASVTADLAMIPSLQLLFILTNLKPTTKVSELRVDMKYTLLGQRCAMAHDRLAEHSGSNWRRVAEPVLGAGVNISEESVHRVALECGWQVTWMTDEVTTYAQRRSAARQSADTQGRLSFTRGPAPVAPTGVPSQGGVPTSVVSDPAPVAPRDVVSEGRVPDSVVSDPLPTPAPISNPSQAANGRQAGTGEQGRVPIQQPSFSPRAAPRSDPSQAANDGSQAAGREQGRVPSVVQEGRVPVDRIAAHAVNGPVPEQSGISPNQAEAEVASAPEPVELPVPMELDTSENSEPTAGADMTAVVPFVAAKSKAKAKPKAKAKGKSKAKAKARATAPSTESQDEVDIEDQLEDQVEGQAEDQTEADDVDVIDGFVQEEGVQEEDVPNVPAPPNRWNQDICVICHSEMNQDQAGMFHLSLFYEPLIIVTDLYVNSVCLTIPHTGFGSAGVWSPLSL